MMRQLGRYESPAGSSGSMSAGGAGPAGSSSQPSLASRAASVGGAAEKDIHHVSAWTDTSSGQDVLGKPVVSSGAAPVAPSAGASKTAKKPNFFAVVKAAVAAAKEAAVREAAIKGSGPMPPSAAMFEGGTISVLQAAKEMLVPPRWVGEHT